MPGYLPSSFGAATKVRMAEPESGMSAYSEVTIMDWRPENSQGQAGLRQLQIAGNPKMFASSQMQDHMDFINILRADL